MRGGVAIGAVQVGDGGAGHVRVGAYGGRSRAGQASSEIGVASGVNFPDALSGSAYMANLGEPLVLADPRLAPRDSWFSSDLRDEASYVYVDAGTITVFGGPAAVDERIVKDLVVWINGREQ